MEWIINWTQYHNGVYHAYYCAEHEINQGGEPAEITKDIIGNKSTYRCFDEEFDNEADLLECMKRRGLRV